MGQFKPMVKMMTTEPSIELKLKKGGHVAMPKMKSKDHGTGSKKMADGGMPGVLARAGLPPGPVGGAAPAMPPLAARRKAMKMRRPMKEGGESAAEHASEMKKMERTEKELKKHESMPASKAHKGLSGGGGVIMGQGGFKNGGSVIPVSASKRGAEAYDETMMHTAKPDHSPAKTGGVKLGNGGGYKKGGKAHKYAKGGGVEGNVSTTPPGVTNTTTGAVLKGNGGGFKKGGVPKKYARGGSVNDSGKPVLMPQEKPPTPVSINRLSGTYKKGGKVKMMEGGPADIAEEKKRKAMDKAYEDSYKHSAELERAMSPLDMLKEGFDKAKEFFTKKPSGDSVTKTRESVTVTPLKKRYGGSC